MPRLTVLTEQELRQVVQLDEAAIDCIESAFAALAGGNVVMPPILSMAIEEYNGEVDVKTAYVPGFECFAIKMSPGFFDNPSLGLPSTSGLMVLFSVRTGMVEAVLLDNGYLTDVRTAAAGAVAARHLARSDVETVCVVGTGNQARLQLAALCLVRKIRRAIVWGRSFEKAEAAASELQTLTGLEVSAESELEYGVRASDVVITATPSSEPLIRSDWLLPGQHITAMGSDQSHKNELEPGCLSTASLYVPDRRSQTEILGELHHALAAGAVNDGTKFPELGDVVSGKAAGRRSPDDITICDLTGTGVQDTAIATFASQRAKASSAGLIIES